MVLFHPQGEWPQLLTRQQNGHPERHPCALGISGEEVDQVYLGGRTSRVWDKGGICTPIGGDRRRSSRLLRGIPPWAKPRWSSTPPLPWPWAAGPRPFAGHVRRGAALLGSLLAATVRNCCDAPGLFGMPRAAPAASSLREAFRRRND